MPEPAFDHAILLSDSLEDGIAGLTRLGFRPTPPGVHGAGLGTENVTVVLPDGETYFEVLAIREATARNAGKRDALAALGRHVHGLAIKGDARRLHERFVALDLAAGEPFDFARDVTLPEGTREARFTIAAMADDALPGLYGFVCQQHTPETVWRADYLDQPNGARGIVGLLGIADDPVALADVWRPLFGAAVGLEDDGMTVELGGTHVRYLTPTAWEAAFGPVVGTDEGPRLLALAFAVPDLAGLAALLAGNGVPFERRDGCILVPDAVGLGASFLFVTATL